MVLSRFEHVKILIKTRVCILETLPDQIYNYYKQNEITYSEYKELMHMMKLKPRNELLS